VKALACALPRELGLPLARLSREDLRRFVLERGIVESISGTTIWRWLDEDAIRPWRYRSWIFPRDPLFAEKAGIVLDLYARIFASEPLGHDEYVLCADEKTSIQARKRLHPTIAAGPGRPALVEHEYERGGALAYLAALDVHQPRLIGRCEKRSGIEPFDRLVEQVMLQAPYCWAKRVFLIVDNGSAHRGARSIERLEGRWPNLRLIHLPIQPPGSIKSRSTFRSSSASCSSRTTSPTWPASSGRSSTSSATTPRSPSRSSGASPAPTSTGYSPASQASKTCPRRQSPSCLPHKHAQLRPEALSQ